MTHDTHEFKTVKEVAAILRVNDRTVLRMVARGQLRHARVGRQIRVPAEAIRELTSGDASSTPHAA